MSIKLLTEHHLESLSLKGGYTSLSVSTFVEMRHCWKSHVMAHLTMLIYHSHFLTLSPQEVTKSVATDGPL